MNKIACNKQRYNFPELLPSNLAMQKTIDKYLSTLQILDTLVHLFQISCSV